MNKHTPGPWAAVQGVFWTVETLDGQRVANTLDSECVFIGAEEHDDSEVNARLISAAPDLLAALEECLPCLGWEHDSDEEIKREHELGNGYAELILRARAAIAKALGK